MEMKQGVDKIKILAIEGPDKVGKTTIIKKINQRTNYEYLCIDRFIGSAWVYDHLYKRRERQQMLTGAERELVQLRTILIVNILLKCNKEILLQRILHEEKDATDRTALLDHVIKLYDEYSKHISILPIIEIDTTGKSVEETVTEIIQEMKKL